MLHPRDFDRGSTICPYQTTQQTFRKFWSSRGLGTVSSPSGDTTILLASLTDINRSSGLVTSQAGCSASTRHTRAPALGGFGGNGSHRTLDCYGGVRFAVVISPEAHDFGFSCKLGSSLGSFYLSQSNLDLDSEMEAPLYVFGRG